MDDLPPDPSPNLRLCDVKMKYRRVDDDQFRTIYDGPAIVDMETGHVVRRPER